MSSECNLHRSAAPWWIDGRHECTALGDLALDSGDAILDCQVSWVSHGPADASAVLALCAIGSNHHRLDFLIGPGKALDTQRHRVIVVDALGNGWSSSPSNSLRQPGTAFPRFSIRDMVRSQSRLLDVLGIDRLDLVVGASMGGMQALQWGVSQPQRVRRIVALAPLARTPGWTAAVNEAARRALAPACAVDAGVDESVSRQAWTSWALHMQLMAVATPDHVNAQLDGSQALARWLDQRQSLWRTQELSALDWTYQSWAYDDHDLGRTPGIAGGVEGALKSITAPTLVLGAALDLYNPAACARQAAQAIPGASYVEIASPWGHWTFSAADAGSAAAIESAITGFLHGQRRQ